jgi:hypothetical protein
MGSHRAIFFLFLSISSAAQAAELDGEKPEARFERLRQAEVVIVRGSADHMEEVMRRAKMKFVVVGPEELPQLPLHGQQVLMVNCTGEMSPAARERVRRFVTAGGLLYTTDHAVHFLVEKIFPGYLKYRGVTSTEQIFPMQTTGEQGLLAKIGSSSRPRWQLAGGGYLFDVIDPHRVEVLMRSSEVGARYGAPVLGVRFRVGDGQVVHVTGHFYTQPGQRPEVAAAGRAFEQISANVVAVKAAQNPELRALYDQSPRRQVVLRSAPEAAAPPAPSTADLARGPQETPAGVTTTPAIKVRVLERRGKAAKVRDTQGNEGWVDADAL